MRTLIYLAPLSCSQFLLSLAFLWHTFFYLESLLAICFFLQKCNQFILLLAYVLNSWGASDKVKLFLFTIWWILCFYRYEYRCLHIAFCWYIWMCDAWLLVRMSVLFLTVHSFLTIRDWIVFQLNFLFMYVMWWSTSARLADGRWRMEYELLF